MDSINYYRISLEEVLGKLKGFFESRYKSLDLVIVFGSATRRSLVRDIDVAVYSRKGLSLRDILLLNVDLERLLGMPVDVVPLDKAPAKLKVKILTQGVIVKAEGKSLYAELLKAALADSMDLDIKLKYARKHS